MKASVLLMLIGLVVTAVQVALLWLSLHMDRKPR